MLSALADVNGESSVSPQEPSGQGDSHGAADWVRTVLCGHGCGCLPAPGGPDAPAPTLGCSLPTRPLAYAYAGQPTAGGLQDHVVLLQGKGASGGEQQRSSDPSQ